MPKVKFYMSEKYEPSQKEINDIENMNESEKKLTERREAHIVSLEQKGIEGHLYQELKDKMRLFGEINGHKIDISCKYAPGGSTGMGQMPPSYSFFEGTIDGEPLAEDDAEKLFMKYQDLAMSKFEEDYLIRQSEQEKLKVKQKDKLKDLL